MNEECPVPTQERGRYGAFLIRGACGNLFEAGTPNFRLGEGPCVRATHRAPAVGARQTAQPGATHVPRPDTSDHRGIPGGPGLPPTCGPVRHLGTQYSPATTPRWRPGSRALAQRAHVRTNSASPEFSQSEQSSGARLPRPPGSQQSETSGRSAANHREGPTEDRRAVRTWGEQPRSGIRGRTIQSDRAERPQVGACGAQATRTVLLCQLTMRQVSDDARAYFAFRRKVCAQTPTSSVSGPVSDHLSRAR
ncbi:hypothetical protein JOF40_003857 [Aeromicrobium fastidiosum]|nr:hypothetical protein [Aeromicrobium fastidiosum]